MLHRAIAVVLIIVWSAGWAFAQEVAFTIDSLSASVYKAPSTGSPVIGQARRGAVLDVTRELGSWMKVRWPEAPDGVGYVHVSMGSTRGAAPAAATTTSSDAHGESSLGRAPLSEPAQHVPIGTHSTSAQQPGYVVAPSHVIGMGAQFGGSAIGAGVNARAWFHDRVGLQIEFTRSSLAGLADQRLTTTHFAPCLLLSVADLMTDYVWVRPYVGAGPRLLNQSLKPAPQAAATVSDQSFGFQTFGGAEFTFAGMPRFTLSADLRYGWADAATPGFDVDGVGVSLSGHWYVK